MTVYVIQEMPYKDILSAEAYGKLVSIIEPGYQLYISPKPIVEKVREALKNFNNDDYLLLIGDPSIIGVACSIASDINMGRYKVLKWDRREERYYPIEFNIKGENEE